MKSDDQVAAAIDVLKTAHGRLKEALKAVEQTSYYYGGVGFKKEDPTSEEEEQKSAT